MLVGQDTVSYFEDLKVGDMVYISADAGVDRWRNYYYTDDKPSSYHGIVVEVPEKADSNGYLSIGTMVGVLVDNKINWYMPNELLRIGTRDFNKDS